MAVSQDRDVARFIADHPGTTASAISKQFGLTRRQTERVLAKLRERGIVQKHGGRKHARYTPAGTELPAVEPELENVFLVWPEIDPQDLRAFAESLGKLAAELYLSGKLDLP